MKNEYVRMEHARSCLTDIDKLLSDAEIARTNVAWRHLFDDPNLYILTARNKYTQHLEGYAVYHIQDRVAACQETHGSMRAMIALRKAAQGWMRWKGARKVT